MQFPAGITEFMSQDAAEDYGLTESQRTSWNVLMTFAKDQVFNNDPRPSIITASALVSLYGRDEGKTMYGKDAEIDFEIGIENADMRRQTSVEENAELAKKLLLDNSRIEKFINESADATKNGKGKAKATAEDDPEYIKAAFGGLLRRMTDAWMEYMDPDIPSYRQPREIDIIVDGIFMIYRVAGFLTPSRGYPSVLDDHSIVGWSGRWVTDLKDMADKLGSFHLLVDEDDEDNDMNSEFEECDGGDNCECYTVPFNERDAGFDALTQKQHLRMWYDHMISLISEFNRTPTDIKATGRPDLFCPSDVMDIDPTVSILPTFEFVLDGLLTVAMSGDGFDDPYRNMGGCENLLWMYIILIPRTIVILKKWYNGLEKEKKDRVSGLLYYIADDVDPADDEEVILTIATAVVYRDLAIPADTEKLEIINWGFEPAESEYYSDDESSESSEDGDVRDGDYSHSEEEGSDYNKGLDYISESGEDESDEDESDDEVPQPKK